MGNTSNKHRNKKIAYGSIIILGLLLVGSFIISRSSNRIDPASFADVTTYPIEARIKGDAEAPLQIVEYSDFQCPACRNAAPSLDSYLALADGQFNLEYRHLPLSSIHPNARRAAQAAEAAGVQGKFWEMHDLLFANQGEWGTSINPRKFFVEYAEELDLNVDRFRYDYASDEVKAKIDADIESFEALEAPMATPSFSLDGQAIQFETFVQQLTLPQGDSVSIELDDTGTDIIIGGAEGVEVTDSDTEGKDIENDQ